MNKIIKTLSTIVAVLVVFNASAQKIEFEETTHDFGNILVDEIPVTNTFKFKNTGDKPLVISNVRTSCGCTSPSWSKEPVQPGATGEVKATYTTKSAFPFSKNVTVMSNGGSVVLTIKGNPQKQPEDLNKTYPDAIGNLRVKNKRDLNFPQINSKTTTPAQVIDVANATDANVTVEFENVPEYLTVAAVPATLSPKQKGQITVSVNGAKAKTYGYKTGKFTIKAGNAKENVNVTSIVAEALDKTDNDPTIEVTNFNVDLGDLAANKASGVFEIKNTGKSDLVIKSFTTTNSAFTANLKKEVKIKPGKTGEVKFTASNLKKGNNTAEVYLGTNAPGAPIVKYNVKANVK